MVSVSVQISVAIVAVVQVAFSLTPLETFYPPNLNDTSYISNSSIGTYGGVYQASTNANESSPYGLVANGSVKAKIVYLEYLQRHQRRTPYNILPGGENKPFNCDDILPYLYASPQSGDSAPIPVYAQTYSDPTNRFPDTYVNGSCQYPQLTIEGLLDGFQHGADLSAVYGAKLGLFPATPDTGKVWFRSTEPPLTQQSAGGVLRGVFPSYQVPLPLHQQTSAVDTVNEGFSCPAISSTLSAIESTAEWNDHLSVTATLRSKLGTMLGETTSAWQDTFDHFSDNFQGRLYNGYVFPCNVNNQSDCVSMAQADEVFCAGDWEWNYYWRANSYAKQYITLVEGLFIGEILSHFETVRDGKVGDLKYSHIFIHDGDIGPVLGALGINVLRWPAMGSNIAFGIWEVEEKISTFYARVLYSGQPVETIHGTLDWLLLDDLIAILQPYVPTDIVAMCNA